MSIRFTPSHTGKACGFLRDITGNRRFWPVRVNGESVRKPWQISGEDVLQVWAEAKTVYENGERLYLEGDVAAMAVSEQAEAMETDDREGLVRTYLTRTYMLLFLITHTPLRDSCSLVPDHPATLDFTESPVQELSSEQTLFCSARSVPPCSHTGRLVPSISRLVPAHMPVVSHKSGI